MNSKLQSLRPYIAALSLLAVSACAQVGITQFAEGNRLVAAGYRLASSEIGRSVLVYSGAPTSDIRCLTRRGGDFAPLSEIVERRDATVQYRSDIRVTLRSGAVGQPVDREAFYVLTAITTPKRRGRSATLETINFSSGGQARFRSGMTCRGR